MGKTAIAEGLAIRVSRGDVPGFLAGKRVMSLDVGLLMAGMSNPRLSSIWHAPTWRALYYVRFRVLGFGLRARLTQGQVHVILRRVYPPSCFLNDMASYDAVSDIQLAFPDGGVQGARRAGAARDRPRR